MTNRRKGVINFDIGEGMLTEKQKKQKAFFNRKLICVKCDAIMHDNEPFNPDGQGEFGHPLNFCKNSGKYFKWDYDPDIRNLTKRANDNRIHGIQQFVPKKFRR